MENTFIPFLVNSEGKIRLCMAINDMDRILESIRVFTNSEKETWDETLFCAGETISFKDEVGQVIATMTPYFPVYVPKKLQPVSR